MGDPNAAVVGSVVALYEIGKKKEGNAKCRSSSLCLGFFFFLQLFIIFHLGCMFGALSCGTIGDILGRKRTIRVGSIILIVGAILQAAMIDLPMAIVSRIITGVGNGMITATVPVYQVSQSPQSGGRGPCFDLTPLLFFFFFCIV